MEANILVTEDGEHDDYGGDGGGDFDGGDF